MQLRVGVGLFSVPCASLPCQVLKCRIAVLVKHRAEIDESLGLRDQGCQDVGGNGVDREDMRETIFRLDSLRLLVADGSIVDDGVERAQRIDLLCDLSSLGNCAEIPDNDCLRLRDVPLCLVGAGLASGVQDDPVTLLNQQIRCHPAEAISRSGDEYACHSLAPSHLEMICLRVSLLLRPILQARQPKLMPLVHGIWLLLTELNGTNAFHNLFCDDMAPLRGLGK